MKAGFSTAAGLVLLCCLLLVSACSIQKEGGPSPASSRKIVVAQQGAAEVVGNDNIALQKAADMLKPGDTLEIGPGVYTLENSVVIPVCGVVVQGVPGKTILRKGPGVASKVIDGGDWGESDLVVAEPEKFRPGMGVSMLDDRNRGGYSVVVATIERIDADTLRLSEWSVNDLNYVDGNTRVESKFPLLCAYGRRDITIEGITADGNKDENPYLLDGCRGGAIYLFNCRNCTIKNCVASNYNGDGISFQITDSISVIGCEAYGNTGYGMHPGTGSSRSVIKDCHMHHNGRVGFFLCYRVRYGSFTDNLIEHNGRYGISIGHKDSDNLFVNNTVRNNDFCGVYFRRNKEHVGGHRNVFRNNKILDNGSQKEGYGVFVESTNKASVFEENQISETRSAGARTQQYGVYVKSGPSSVTLADNSIQGNLKGEYYKEK
jgi:parallel beta-helix repeat protein